MPDSGLFERILRARVYDVARETPLEPAQKLSERLGNRVLIKREDLQPVFSFKLRGAYNKISLLPEADLQRGVIAASAGNHAQGVALAARALGAKATIVMPRTTPGIKVEAVRRLGGEIVLDGDGYDEAYARARAMADEGGATFVHAYDDEDVIAGQGTIAMEILRQHRGPLDAIFVPVGGGGLIAGIAAYTKRLHPEVRVIGVESDESACLAAALRAGERVCLDQVGLFADGTAVRQVGAAPWAVAHDLVDEVIEVSTDEICAAIKDIFDDTRSIAEPAGALAVAGLKSFVLREGCSKRTLVAIDTGANMNFDRLRQVAERAEIGEDREAIFALTIPERPGSFAELCGLLGDHGITEFNYRYGTGSVAGGLEAHVFVGVAISDDGRERQALKSRLESAGLDVVDMSHDELAMLHIRYMVGGRAEIEDERLLRFEFPERPGALMRFLAATGGRWNISLFHYRNHGAAYGRVLVGMQIPEEDDALFYAFLDELGYAWWEETENPAYQLFLR